MREGGGVHDDRRAPPSRLLHGVDQVGLGVRLDVLDVKAVTLGLLAGTGHVFLEGCRAVDQRLALAEQVQVGARQQENDRIAHSAISFSAASTSAAATPATGSTPAGPSSTNVMPATAFLSRLMSSRSWAVSASGGRVIGRSYPPTTFRCSSTRRRSMRPRRSARTAAKTRPLATAS